MPNTDLVDLTSTKYVERAYPRRTFRSESNAPNWANAFAGPAAEARPIWASFGELGHTGCHLRGSRDGAEAVAGQTIHLDARRHRPQNTTASTAACWRGWKKSTVSTEVPASAGGQSA